MFLPLIEVAARLAILVIEWFLNKKTNTDELKKAFNEFTELARKENILTIKKNKSVEEGYQLANDEWDRIKEESENGNIKPKSVQNSPKGPGPKGSSRAKGQ